MGWTLPTISSQRDQSTDLGYKFPKKLTQKNDLRKHNLKEIFNILPFLLHLHQGFYDFSCVVSCKSKYKLHIDINYKGKCR